MPDDFYWRHARDSLLTERALQMFQILASREGEIFDEAKTDIDKEYETAVGAAGKDRHGGIIQSQLQVFREAGWATLSKIGSSAGRIEVTPAGKQALLLLKDMPDFLKAAPFFIVELLSRYQLNNPARPQTAKNALYDKALADASVFPYWTLLKAFRSLGNYITADELRRFVFKVHKHEDLSSTLEKIKSYRTALSQNVTSEELDEKFGHALEGSIGEPKYLMGRLGTQVGNHPPLIQKEGQSKWVLNENYNDFVDKILTNEPIFKEHLSEESWMHEYGRPVDFEKLLDSQNDDDSSADQELLANELLEDDEIFAEVKALTELGSGGVLLSGPPGTGKSWYARQIAAKLSEGNQSRMRFLQFHPSMSYDDFIEGYVPVLGEGGTSFEIKQRIFLNFCDAAATHPEEIYTFVIDEINRGDVSNIFGELLTYVEPTYRNKSFRLAYSGRQKKIPPNVFIIGTFNPYDRSVAELDDAFDRRFDRISIEPSPAELRRLLLAKGTEPQLVNRLTEFFVEINKKSRHGIGHASFLDVADDASLNRLWNRKLKFLLEKSHRFEPELLASAKEKFRSVYTDAQVAKL